MKNINTGFIVKTVNKAFWPIAIYAYVIVPAYCFVNYGYVPNTIQEVQDLWDTKQKLLDLVRVFNG